MKDKKFAARVRGIMQEVNALIKDKEILKRLSDEFARDGLLTAGAAASMLSNPDGRESSLGSAHLLPEGFSLVEISDYTGYGEDVVEVYVLRRRGSPIGFVYCCIGNGRTDYSWQINRTQRHATGYTRRNTAAAAAVEYYLNLK